MSTDVTKALEKLARLAETTGKPEEASRALDETLAACRVGASPRLRRLEEELIVWKTKLPVILGEPAGRKGLANHARHWIAELAKPEGR